MNNKSFPIGKVVKCIDNVKKAGNTTIIVRLTEGRLYTVLGYQKLSYGTDLLVGVINDMELESFYRQERFISSNVWKGAKRDV